ncbi:MULTISPECIES: hypothetical protein [unclassified Janthinobacterium]|uniref:hypothetical protein n=1 Tax=unclassified Janthinobacterium TaxID=2610881 RepID=UPI0012FCC16A|nr:MULTISPECIES: hypothetical protein [unclassified Janthinobacterium]
MLPLAVFAEPASEPADALAPVPATRYDSVFAQYRPATEQKDSPDKVWRAVNKEVEGGGMAHMDHAAAPAATPGKAESKPAPAAADPHAGHDMHMQHQQKGK